MNTTTAMQAEEKDNEIVRKAKEALDYACERENVARKALNSATETRKLMKEKYEKVFLEAEIRAYGRRKSGTIEPSKNY